ncbi:MAG: cysteine desulfurase NifS [Pyrinomonadaceae bacterium]|nr:cysteine desulfurase NifS [Pyrinomonadaceae bacterium]MCX7640267.1 cysteine desulfurase NifS [Pyrinomonadaceae bacterium]MDW8305285.1 cysteine desulfurase NifS [Acidobacteriota bacterium]
MRRVYLDNSATTPIAPEVLEAMMPYLTDKFGNASSIHFFGQQAKAAVDKARHQVSSLINAKPNEIVFTSGGTESNNLAIRGLVQANEKYGKHIITCQIEHPSVKEVCIDLERKGYKVTYLPVYEDGIVRIEDLKSAIREETVLISIMTANNEIGTLQPVEEIGNFVTELRKTGKKIWFHTDAVQAVGKVAIDVEQIKCDLLSISAHKLYAPKGIGALYVRSGVRLQRQNIGGRQERERRGGTENVAGIVAFGKACEIAQIDLDSQASYLKNLRDRFEHEVAEKIENIVFNGNREKRLPHISNISFRYVEGEGLLINLDMQGIAVSTGSACSSGSLEPSPVIRALGRDDELARSAIRFSFGKFNTEADVDYLLEVLPKAVRQMREFSPILERSRL